MNGWMLYMRLEGRGLVSLSGFILGKLLPLSPSSTGQRAMMPCGWEGNPRYGVALDVRHIDLSSFFSA